MYFILEFVFFFLLKHRLLQKSYSIFFKHEWSCKHLANYLAPEISHRNSDRSISLPTICNQVIHFSRTSIANRHSTTPCKSRTHDTDHHERPPLTGPLGNQVRSERTPQSLPQFYISARNPGVRFHCFWKDYQGRQRIALRHTSFGWIRERGIFGIISSMERIGWRIHRTTVRNSNIIVFTWTAKPWKGGTVSSLFWIYKVKLAAFCMPLLC